MSLLPYFGTYPLSDKKTANQYISTLSRYKLEYNYDDRRNYMEIRTDAPLLVLNLLEIIPVENPNWKTPNSDWKNSINTLLVKQKDAPNPSAVSMR